MSESPIQHVADTAFWVATYRAIESERPDALFRDPLAARLVEGRGRAIASQMQNSEGVAWSVVMRTCVIDEYLHEAIGNGCDLVINLGAGLDTRPYRLELPESLAWVEVDFPATIEYKEQRLSGEKPRCQLRRIKLDLGDAAARRALFAELNAQGKKALILTEGVVPYLSNEEAAALAADLSSQPHFVSWVVDYFSPQFMKLTQRSGFRKQMARAPFKFAPADWHAFFQERGWTVQQMRYLGDESMRRNRLPPMPRWVKLFLPILRLLVPERRKAWRNINGYALLTRAAM